MKSCELCKSPARIYCDSDQASLCWTCDTKVHSANFLVARHSRTLLCRTCQSPTPWSAFGQILGPSTVSVCQKCVSGHNDKTVSVTSENDDDVIYETEDDDENELEDDDQEEDGDDNQVVPLCSTSPPPASSSGSDDDELFSGCAKKRKRENVLDLSSDEDEIECSVANKVRALLDCKASSSEAIVEKMKMFRHRERIPGENESGGVGLDLNLNL